MSNRPLSSFRGRLVAGTAGLLVAGSLVTACVEPPRVDPFYQPPVAEAPPELYGAPEGEPGALAEAQPGTDPYAPVDPAAPPAPTEAYAELRRPGWGTMEPIPNPPGSPATDQSRAYAETAPADGRPSEQDRVQAYAPPSPPLAQTLPPVPAPEAYAELYRAPAPLPPPAPLEAPYAEGEPASSYPSTVVTMPPIPNPIETGREPRVRDEIEPRAEREAPPRRAARATDDRLLGGPARPRAERRSASAATAAGSSRPAAATAASAARNAAPARPAGQTAQQGAARNPRPAADTPAGRQAALNRLRSVLTTQVERDSTLAVDPARTGVAQRVTLTLPAGLAETLIREANAAGLSALASRAEVRTLLRGEGWRIEPEEPQNGPLTAGQVSSFTWTATPGRDAGPLTADVSANLSGGGRFETLDLGEVRRSVEGAEGAAEEPGGLSARAIAAAALLLLLLLGALWYARRGNGPADGSRRRFNRRRPEPVNLTPYSPAADTDAPRDADGPTGDPKPA